ncbi:MAG: hypothetical protein ACK5T6_15985 [Pirellula sp.]|jgi:hypothetical protein
MKSQPNQEDGLLKEQTSERDLNSKNMRSAPQHRGGKWWQGRLTLSTILAISLSTYFVVASTVASSNRPTNQGIEAETEINIVFPTIPLMAVALCWFADLMIWILQTETFDRKNPIASVLIATLVRTMVILGSLAFSSATKWPAHNLFGTYLVGCYFSFLALESWLAIRRSATRNYSPKPL